MTFVVFWYVSYKTAFHRTRVIEHKTGLSTNDSTTKFCTSFLVVNAVYRLPSSVLLVLCEIQVGRRLEVGAAPRSELLFGLLSVREQDTCDCEQVKWWECLDMARVGNRDLESSLVCSELNTWI